MYYGNCGGTSTVTKPAQHAQLQTAFVLSTDMYGTPKPAAPEQSYQSTGVPSFLDPNYKSQQQACYGNASSTVNAGQPANSNTVRLNTSSFSKVSVEVAKEHMELLNTLVSAYCGLVAGQIGNINLTQEDYQQIDKDEMDLMDIKWAFASAVRRAKDFMERTGRTSLESKKDTKYGFDKQAVKCFNCGERGHFKRECTKPAQHGNQNPFRNQGNQQNQTQTRNNERALMPTNNTHQAGPSNNNRALVVQVVEGCDWSIQLGGGDQGGIACFAEVVKDLKHACGGESSDEDSSGYSGSSDEETSSSGEDGTDEVSHESIDADVEELLREAKAGNDRRSILVDQAAYSSSLSSHHSAFMANVGSSSSQVCVDESKSDKCDNCVDLGGKLSDLQSKYDDLQSKYDVTFIHNQSLIVDLAKCTEANLFHKNHEKEFKKVIDTLKEDKTELIKTVSRKQSVINNYIPRLEEAQKELACVKCEYEAI
ncbi:putative transcription factor interactor and regulator CCHC(Zn) family [Helianthus annuus]|nr:putative transcription factor interactor and regulator CCHC(Zn) family [Helianthus annuus]